MSASRDKSDNSVFCTFCGKRVAKESVVCIFCGVDPTAHKNFCRTCGGALNSHQVICLQCGMAVGRSHPKEKEELVRGSATSSLTDFTQNSAGTNPPHGTTNGHAGFAAMHLTWFWVPMVTLIIWAVLSGKNSQAKPHGVNILNAFLSSLLYWVILGIAWGVFFAYPVLATGDHVPPEYNMELVLAFCFFSAALLVLSPLITSIFVAIAAAKGEVCRYGFAIPFFRARRQITEQNQGMAPQREKSLGCGCLLVVIFLGLSIITLVCAMMGKIILPYSLSPSRIRNSITSSFSTEGWLESEAERQVLKIRGVEYAFRWCPAGKFTMGSPYEELGRESDETQHEVTLSKGFWMLETEVTQAMWEGVMGSNPSYFKGKKLPVEQVSWDDCQKFITKLNEMSLSAPGMKFSLPTEAQWEYACRAGTTTSLNSGKNITSASSSCPNLNELGWYYKNSDSKTHEVGLKKPNLWGLYDMHGNVWEWCSDWYDSSYYSKSPSTNPLGPDTGTGRVLRGGSWSDFAGDCRSAFRFRLEPSLRGYSLGFRLSLVGDTGSK